MPGARSGGAIDLAVVGHVNVDRFLFADRLPATDRTTPLTGQAERLGGTATNMARAAARAGLRTALVSGIGPDFPKSFLGLLRAERIDLSGLARYERRRSSACFIVEDGRGGQVTLIDQGPLADEERFRFSDRTVRRAAFAHLSTGRPEEILRLAASVHGGPRLSVDPAQEIHYRWDRRRFLRLLPQAEILFGNRAELAQAARLARCAGPSALLEHVPLVVGTLGADGAIAWSRRGNEQIPARRPRRLRQVTGAGDAFRGGFYGGWATGAPLRECLRSGVESATRWIEGEGSLGDRAAAPARRRPR